MGPTASGKTGVAVELVRRLPLEIISVDSALVYRYMNIGTAKPDTATLAAAPHHLIDLIDPTESYSAAQFREGALRVMHDISARGKIPFLVGGTMLYFKALREGLDNLPKADAAVRANIAVRATASGWPVLHAALARVDAVSAARLNPNDAQRIGRALEIYELTGQPMSRFFKASPADVFPYRGLPISLMPSDRAALHARIAQRFDSMLRHGLVEEVARLRARFDLDPQLPAMRCVGYRQAWQYQEGAISCDELRDRGIFATRQLAKRQMTWLRGMSDTLVIDCLADNLVERVEEAVRSFLSA